MSSSTQDLAYALLRVTLGVNFFVHGLVRLPDLAGFAQGVAGSFEGTLLPVALALPFAYAIPIVELIAGGLLIVGLFTKPALVVLSLLMIGLHFGMAIRQEWGVLADQLIYVFLLFLLLYLHREAFSVDLLRERRS
ncbi:MAG: DoxX family protein [Bacteroidota bacterium]